MASSFVPNTLEVCYGLQKVCSLEKCLLISIASNFTLIALRPFISSDDINGLNQVQDQLLRT